MLESTKNGLSFNFQKLMTLASKLVAADIHEAWIGANDINGDDVVKFLESDTLLNLTLWINGAPDHRDGNCVKFDAVVVRLALEECSDELPFICEIV